MKKSILNPDGGLKMATVLTWTKTDRGHKACNPNSTTEYELVRTLGGKFKVHVDGTDLTLAAKTLSAGKQFCEDMVAGEKVSEAASPNADVDPEYAVDPAEVSPAPSPEPTGDDGLADGIVDPEEVDTDLDPAGQPEPLKADEGDPPGGEDGRLILAAHISEVVRPDGSPVLSWLNI